MSTLSQGAYIAWQLAAVEAARSKHRRIEKEDVFLGICRLGIWLRSTSPDGELIPKEEKILEALCTEAEVVEETLRTFALSPLLLCQAVRKAIGTGTHRHTEQKTVHRSKACKACFQRAEALAGTGETHCLHLLTALLEHPGQVLSETVQIFGVDITALHARAVVTIDLLDARRAQVEHMKKGVSHIIYVGVDFHRRNLLPA